MTSRDATAFLNVHFAVGFDIEGGSFTAQTLGISSICSLLSRISKTTFRRTGQDLLSGVIQRAQDDGSRQLTTTVDTNEQVVFRVEFEVQPEPR